MTAMEPQPVYASSVYITAPAERVWAGITQSELTQRWYFGTSVESSWEVGSPVIYRREGAPLFEGTVLEISPPKLLVTTFVPLFLPGARGERPARVSWRVTAVGQDVKLDLTFEDIDAGSAT